MSCVVGMAVTGLSCGVVPDLLGQLVEHGFELAVKHAIEPSKSRLRPPELAGIECGLCRRRFRALLFGDAVKATFGLRSVNLCALRRRWTARSTRSTHRDTAAIQRRLTNVADDAGRDVFVLCSRRAMRSADSLKPAGIQGQPKRSQILAGRDPWDAG